MEHIIATLATVVNPFKKNDSAGTSHELQRSKKGDRRFTAFSDLPTELRLEIWALCYLMPQPSRIVEVRTQIHGNCPGHEGFCPRYSPTRKHVLVNTCHESRDVARREALRAGHLIFSSPSCSSPSDEIIIFKPTDDLLYLPTDAHPLPLTRGPKGTYAQYKKGAAPRALLFLALDLERHGSQFNPMRCAIHDFPALQDLLFVAPGWSRAYQVEGLQENLQVLRNAWERRTQDTWPYDWTEEQEADGAQTVDRGWPQVRVAVRCLGGWFKVLEDS